MQIYADSELQKREHEPRTYKGFNIKRALAPPLSLSLSLSLSLGRGTRLGMPPPRAQVARIFRFVREHFRALWWDALYSWDAVIVGGELDCWSLLLVAYVSRGWEIAKFQCYFRKRLDKYWYVNGRIYLKISANCNSKYTLKNQRPFYASTTRCYRLLLCKIFITPKTS